jgi:O-antigen/teichoic acid export membrane protein
MVKKLLGERGGFLRMFSGGVAIQAMLSACNFAVGLLLVRRTSQVQYGYYVLITTTVLLTTSVQWSFISPPMVIRLTRSNRSERADLIGGLYRDQRRLLGVLALAPVLFGIVQLLRGKLDLPLAVTLVAGTAAVVAAMHRDFLRSILFAYRLPNEILRSDVAYCALLVLGAFAATLTPLPAAIAALTMSFACAAGALLLSKAVWRHEPWNPQAPPGMLRAIAPVGALSAVGSLVHVLYSQGYNYIVAGTLDVTAVATLAATRLLLNPINLLSTGVNTLLFPTVTRWLQDLSGPKVFGRLALVATGLAGLACCYLLVMWLMRDWIFAHVLKKDFPQRDLLLLLWSAISILMLFRDQLLHFLVARARFRLTSSMTAVSAVVAISCTLIAMHHVGTSGALLGLLAGEIFSVTGIIFFSLRDARRMQPVIATPLAPAVPQLED